jgi:S-DNA-T family DNA segregation ATPase FtsK/SpoIIIE
MTYTFNTLNVSSGDKAAPRSGFARFGHEVALLLGFLALVFWSLALTSYSPLDAAWSTSGGLASAPIANWGGRLGAWLADISYFVFGFSAWWCVAAGAGAWLASLAGWIRAGQPNAPSPKKASLLFLLRRRMLFWLGLALLLTASAGMEWSRMYRFEGFLPGHAGGVLGYVVGPTAMQWLGFTGSGLLAIALAVAGAGLVFRFSWSRVAEVVGRHIDGLLQWRRTWREVAEDVAVGKRAALQREGAVKEERSESKVLHARPLRIIEPVLFDTPLPPQEGDADVDDAAEHVDFASSIDPTFDLAASPAAGSALAPSLASVLAPSGTAAGQGASASTAKDRLAADCSPRRESLLPPLSLLDGTPTPQDSVDAATLEMISRLIEKKLKDFGVEVRVLEAMPGPVITRYEVEPATGVKSVHIAGLAKDLARALSLASIRVIESAESRSTVMLELPNAKRHAIKLGEIFRGQSYQDSQSLLTIGLGKDIVGNPVVVDLAKMPHVLVAGTTGSGKSVGINAMILSMLFKAEAKDLRLLLIDPKMLEMSVYDGIPHLIAPVVTDMKQAAYGLNWCAVEMERRYKLMAKMGVRTLAGYNAKVAEAVAARARRVDDALVFNPDVSGALEPLAPPELLDHLPHIVIVIDELADLMLVVGKRIEELIARLAQKARDAGIHLVLATQRPSPNVVTELLKANIPARISFQVSTRTDSLTMLDQMGAEALLGMGDMLYMANGADLLARVHGAFVSDEEVQRVVAFLKSKGKPSYINGVLKGSSVERRWDSYSGADGGANGGADPLYEQAVQVVLADRNTAVAHIQRELRITYSRSARLIEQMEKDGIVGTLNSAGEREVLLPERNSHSGSDNDQ